MPKNPFDEVVRMMADVKPLAGQIIPPFDVSGSMDASPVIARGGTSYEEVMRRIREPGAPDPALDRALSKLVPEGDAPRANIIVITDGDLPAPGVTPEPQDPVVEMIRLDHSGSTLDGKPMREGFWRSDAEPDLPMPVTDVDWPERDRFLWRLEQLERQAKTTAYRGFSRCRVCGHPNGSATLSLGAWEWPSGYMHYLREHGVRPSASFEHFVDSAFIKVRAGS